MGGIKHSINILLKRTNRGFDNPAMYFLSKIQGTPPGPGDAWLGMSSIPNDTSHSVKTVSDRIHWLSMLVLLKKGILVIYMECSGSEKTLLNCLLSSSYISCLLLVRLLLTSVSGPICSTLLFLLETYFCNPINDMFFIEQHFRLMKIGNFFLKLEYHSLKM